MCLNLSDSRFQQNKVLKQKNKLLGVFKEHNLVLK